jgi:hypothetical protein
MLKRLIVDWKRPPLLLKEGINMKIIKLLTVLGTCLWLSACVFPDDGYGHHRGDGNGYQHRGDGRGDDRHDGGYRDGGYQNRGNGYGN